MKVKFSRKKVGQFYSYSVTIKQQDLVDTITHLTDSHGANYAEAYDHIMGKVTYHARKKYNLINYPKLEVNIVE